MSVPIFQRLRLRNHASDGVSFLCGSELGNDAFVRGVTGGLSLEVPLGESFYFRAPGATDPLRIERFGAGSYMFACDTLQLPNVVYINGQNVAMSISAAADAASAAQASADSAQTDATAALSDAASASSAASAAASAAAIAQSTADSAASDVATALSDLAALTARVAALESQLV